MLEIKILPTECGGCGVPVAVVGGVALEVERSGFDQWETFDVEHDCDSAGVTR